MKLTFLLLILMLSIQNRAKASDHYFLEQKINVYTDCLGRTTLKPSDIDACLNRNYDSNNALLYSGELLILLKETYGYVPKYAMDNLSKFIPKQFIKKGLLSRHPEPYRFLPTMRTISFDEYTGLGFMASVIPELRLKMDEVVEHGMNNYWQYWDVPSYETGKPLWTIFSFKALKQWSQYLQEESLRKTTLKYPELYPLFSRHQIHQIAFYKMMSSKYKPSLFEKLYFVVTSLLSEYKTDGDSLSMWVFRYKAIDQIGYDSSLINWAKDRWRKKMHNTFGDNYEFEIFKRYYEDKDHPFLAMANKKRQE